jgi:ATP-dependent DNA helicase RecG
VSAPANSLGELKGIGPEMRRKLETLGIRSPRDLAVTYPRDYKDWRRPAPIADVVRRALERLQRREQPESSEEIVVGRVLAVHEFRGRVPIVAADLSDGDPGGATLRATWFGRRGFAGKLAEGDRVFVYGRAQAKRSRGALRAELNVLQHRVLREDETYQGEIVPVYPAGKELTSRALGGLIARNQTALEAFLSDAVPPAILAKRGYGPLPEAWRAMHRPSTPEAASAARERLVFEEFFGLALGAALKRARRTTAGRATPLLAPPALLEEFQAALPFALTGAQRRAIETIWEDMGRSAPMNRLLQGDVGSGKTLVAAAAVVLAARAGVQSALMAPTEILAAQHARKLAPLLLPFGIRVDALFGSLGARERERIRGRLASGECELAVGTHALIVEGVEFARLGLVVIDEQHRFGVAQRAALRSKNRTGVPHTLHMTATPIPRTLAQTKYADLDVTTIDELPPGRTPVETYVLRESRKPLAYAFVRKNVAAGRQAYIVAPAIDESESALTSAISELEVLRRDVFPDLRVELLHGRMPPREKDAVMTRFVRGEADVLLATTVVEVGVDVANAAVMVILDADRYGLAQLHQLRGRVGRGAERSFCILIAPDDFALYQLAKADADDLARADPELHLPEHRRLRELLAEEPEARATLVSS